MNKKQMVFMKEPYSMRTVKNRTVYKKITAGKAHYRLGGIKPKEIIEVRVNKKPRGYAIQGLHSEFLFIGYEGFKDGDILEIDYIPGYKYGGPKEGSGGWI